MKSKSALIIIPHLGIGGTEIQTLNIAKALIEDGWTVNVLCLFRNIPDVVEEYENAGAKVDIVSEEYNNYNVKINYPRGLNLFSFLYTTLKQALREYAPDVIHVQYITPGATIILILRYLFGFNNIIATSHTNADIYSPRGLKIIRFLTNHVLKGFQCITKTAEIGYFGKSKLYSSSTQLGVGSHFTIYNSLPSKIKIVSNSNNHENSKILTIGVVSRLEYIKGVDLVIPSFARVVKDKDNVRLIVVGDGALKDNMVKQSQEFGVMHLIEFVGRKNQSELIEFYDRIDILMMPSRSEGFGLSAIEGMARGCVPLVSAVGGLPEIVNFSEGLLHIPENINDIAQKLELLVSDSTRLNNLRAKGLLRVKDFSNESFNAQISNLYNRLIK